MNGAPSAPSAPRVALATCQHFADLDPDDARLLRPVAECGGTAVPAVWDDPGVDWSSFDLVVLRSTWDYPEKLDGFLHWLGRLPRVLNPAPVVRWNADKLYLRELAAAGLPVLPTKFIKPGEPFLSPSTPFVVKPSVGAGAKDAARFKPGQEEAALQHVHGLHRKGKTAMIQPYLARVEQEGEIGTVFLGGRYSHAIRKAGMLGGGPRVEGPLFVEEDIRPHEATPQERAVAERALRAVPGGADGLLYARVDLLPTAEGRVVSEVELIEPSLFLSYARGGAEQFAELIVAATRAV